jgi:hypothetical protein
MKMVFILRSLSQSFELGGVRGGVKKGFNHPHCHFHHCQTGKLASASRVQTKEHLLAPGRRRGFPRENSDSACSSSAAVFPEVQHWKKVDEGFFDF